MVKFLQANVFQSKGQKRFQHAGAVQPKLLAIQPNFYLPVRRKTFLAIQPNFKWLSSQISSGYPANDLSDFQPKLVGFKMSKFNRKFNRITSFFQEQNQSKATHLHLKKTLKNQVSIDN